jgi:hypothetical protein
VNTLTHRKTSDGDYLCKQNPIIIALYAIQPITVQLQGLEIYKRIAGASNKRYRRMYSQKYLHPNAISHVYVSIAQITLSLSHRLERIEIS